MAFSYDEALSTDADRVRFHLGDTDANGYFLPDATITALLTSEATLGGAVIAGVRYIITQLSKPNFKADWLEVDNDKARQAYEALLIRKQTEFGIGVRTWGAGSTSTYRPDLGQVQPDYAAEYDI